MLAFWKAGYTQRALAKETGVHESTISRELKRNIERVPTAQLLCFNI
ncbi:MAG: helix-turn-helix domain-containing protein [Gammaproteobacteria bacterium]|nr:helix-turn-helix domain-containing protein [Gammaproteobacteria bacterium]